LGSGYNVQQAIVAIGSGGMFGRGIGLGTQSQLNFYQNKKQILFCIFSRRTWIYRFFYFAFNLLFFPFFFVERYFGLPGLEAMENGLPVVSSDSSCLPEIYGDAALYF